METENAQGCLVFAMFTLAVGTLLLIVYGVWLLAPLIAAKWFTPEWAPGLRYFLTGMVLAASLSMKK